MIERRQRQLARVPGFDPVPNKRIDGKFLAELEQLVDAGVDRLAAMNMAYHHIARQLPPIGIGRRHSAPRPSRNDSAAYRKGNRCAHAA